MVENVGMASSLALQAATIHGARAIKRDDEIGSIEKGKYGDIVTCDRNPLEDLSILENPKNIAYVIKDGKIMVRQGKIVYFG